MAELDIAQATTPDTISDYQVPAVVPDSPSDQDETIWDNVLFTKYFGNYKKIAKIKKAIDGYATWVLGKGWEADGRQTAILENMNGWGEDTFNSILWNAIVIKKAGGDSFSEIIRNQDTGVLINLKPLNPERMRIITNRKGIIKRYEYYKPLTRKGTFQEFTPKEILHLCNNRVVDETHGVSDVEAVEWIVESQEEAMRDYRRVLHRNGVARIIYVDTQNTTKIAGFKVQWKDAIEKGDVIILPKDTAEVRDTQNPIQDPLPWVKYLDNLFYMSIGVPRVILGGSEEFTEASSKIGYLTFEQIYLKEQTELEADLWNQVGIRIKLNKPASLKSEMLSSEDKNTGQVGFQPKDTEVGLTRE